MVRAAEALLAHMNIHVHTQLSKELTDRQTDRHGRAASHSHLSALLYSTASIPSEVSWGQKVQTLPSVPGRLSGLTAAKRGAPAGRVWTGGAGLELLPQEPPCRWGRNS